MQQFNKQLELLSHRLTLLRLMKNQLTISSDQLFKKLMQRDQDKKGYYVHEQLRSLWIKNNNVQQSIKNAFLQSNFPMQQVSYTLLSKFILSNQNVIAQNQFSFHVPQIDQKIEQIFNYELLNYISRERISQLIVKVIPSVGSKPSKAQFQDYIICQQLAVDVQVLSKSLNLPEVPSIVPKWNESDNFATSLNEPEVYNLQKIMNRLQQKVNNFGSEWLV